MKRFNPLAMTKRQIIAVSWTAVAFAIAGFIAMGVAASDHLRQTNQVWRDISDTPADIVAPAAAAAAETPVDEAKGDDSAVLQPKATTQAQATPTQPAKTEPVDGGHIPFTNKPVKPGDPTSYIDTVGQCPFYEMAGPKGCYPPSDIVCNADWTICQPVKDLGL